MLLIIEWAVVNERVRDDMRGQQVDECERLFHWKNLGCAHDDTLGTKK